MKSNTNPVDEYRLDEFDHLKRNLETDWNEIVVQNNERQEVVKKINRRCSYNENAMKTTHNINMTHVKQEKSCKHMHQNFIPE